MNLIKKNTRLVLTCIACFVLALFLSVGYSESQVPPQIENVCQDGCSDESEESNENCDNCMYCNSTIQSSLQSIYKLDAFSLNPSSAENIIKVLHKNILVDQIDHPPKSV